jgi:hypothetical protein
MVICLLQQKHRVYDFYKLYIYNMDHARQTLSLLIGTYRTTSVHYIPFSRTAYVQC